MGQGTAGSTFNSGNLKQPTPASTGVQSVTDDGNGQVTVDNTDPANPIIDFTGVVADGTTITGTGLAGAPLQAVAAPPSGVQSVTDDGNGQVTVDNTDPANPIIDFTGVVADGTTITGTGLAGAPLQAVAAPPSGVQSVTDNGNDIVIVDNTDPKNPIVDFAGVAVDGVTIGGNGLPGTPLEVLSSPLPYQIYVAQLYELSNPYTGVFSVNVLQNTLGNISWSRIASGVYIGALTDMFPDQTKVFLTMPDTDTNNGDTNNLANLMYLDQNTVQLSTYESGISGNFTDESLVYIEIRVYP